MNFASRVTDLATRMATEIKTLRFQSGDTQMGAVFTTFEQVATGPQTFPTANTTHYMRVTKGASTVSAIRLQIGTSSGNIGVAIHNNTGSGILAAPGDQIATSGLVVCPSQGAQSVSLGSSVYVCPGMWIGITCDNTTATFLGINITTAYAIMTSLNVRGNGNIPATPTSLTGSQRKFQLLGVP